MKKAIFLYDYTGIMAQPWIDAGYLLTWHGYELNVVYNL